MGYMPPHTPTSSMLLCMLVAPCHYHLAFDRQPAVHWEFCVNHFSSLLLWVFLLTIFLVVIIVPFCNFCCNLSCKLFLLFVRVNAKPLSSFWREKINNVCSPSKLFSPSSCDWSRSIKPRKCTEAWKLDREDRFRERDACASRRHT